MGVLWGHYYNGTPNFTVEQNNKSEPFAHDAALSVCSVKIVHLGNLTYGPDYWSIEGGALGAIHQKIAVVASGRKEEEVEDDPSVVCQFPCLICNKPKRLVSKEYGSGLRGIKVWPL